MFRKTFLPAIYILFAIGFWISPEFKEVAAGVAIFLFGMMSLEQGFRSLAGGAMENILRQSTSSLWKSITFGVLSTTLMQSSALVSVITISFLSAGLIKLAAGIGIIFGANLGTTTGAWLVAGFGLKVKISAYAMPLLVFGIIAIFQKAKSIKGIGYIFTGLGFLFLGIHYMKEGLETLESSINLADFAMAGFLGLITYTLVGIIITILMQSSNAVMVLTITALAANQLTYENAIAITIGANVGTTLTAVISSLSANEQGKRLAVAHVVFNLVTAIIAIVLIDLLIYSTDLLSTFVGIRGDDYTLKLAVFHTLFNLLGVLVMLPFIEKLEKALMHFIKGQSMLAAEIQYLNKSVLDFPDTAVEAIRNESIHLYQNTIVIILNGLGLYHSDLDPSKDIEQAVKQRTRMFSFDIDQSYSQNIKGIYSAIVEFVSHAGFTWKMTQSGDIHWLRQANQQLVEAIKDCKHMRKNLAQVLESDNQYLLLEYNRIRQMLLQTVRAIETIRLDEVPPTRAAINSLNSMVENQYNTLNQNISQLIRDGKISALNGTSLMNDSTYAVDIAKSLILAGETLFVMQRKDYKLTTFQVAEAS